MRQKVASHCAPDLHKAIVFHGLLGRSHASQLQLHHMRISLKIFALVALKDDEQKYAMLFVSWFEVVQ